MKPANTQADLDEILVFCEYGHLAEVFGDFGVEVPVWAVFDYYVHVFGVLEHVVQGYLPWGRSLFQH